MVVGKLVEGTVCFFLIRCMCSNLKNIIIGGHKTDAFIDLGPKKHEISIELRIVSTKHILTHSNAALLNYKA